MPELPEVETVRRTLAARLLGRRAVAVDLYRADVVRFAPPMSSLPTGVLVDVLRHGKQLALRFEGGACVCIHLGMSGQLLVRGLAEGSGIGDRGSGDTGGAETGGLLAPVPGPRLPLPATHEHVRWRFGDGSTLTFRDPRRFGGVWVFGSQAALQAERWGRLGPDALAVTPRPLGLKLGRTGRAVKAALLDQAVVAGLGNIYVDELLFRAGIDPRRPARDVAGSRPAVRGLVGRMRRLLIRAITAGGSTLRDYVDAEGRPGAFAASHRVYGRSGLRCRRCRTPLLTVVVAGRTTVLCPRCQR